MKYFWWCKCSYEGWQLTFNAFICEVFPIKAIKVEGHKILSPKKMLQRLPKALAQVK